MATRGKPPRAANADDAAREYAEVEAVRRRHRALIVEKARAISDSAVSLLKEAIDFAELLRLSYGDRRILDDCQHVAPPEHDPELAAHLRELADAFVAQVGKQHNLVALADAAHDIVYSRPLRERVARPPESHRDAMARALLAEGMPTKTVARIVSAPGVSKGRRSDLQQRRYDAELTKLKRAAREERRSRARDWAAMVRRWATGTAEAKAEQDAFWAAMRVAAQREGGTRPQRE